VKRSGRDKPIQVVIHMCMEAMLEFSLFSCLYLRLAKTLSFLLSLMLSLEQNQRTRRQKRLGGREGELAQTMYIHVNKCKND
jgi:hypothetical protein